MMSDVQYDLSRIGYKCRSCDTNFLHRRPWRWRLCPVCWRERLLGRLLNVGLLLAGVAIGVWLMGWVTAAMWMFVMAAALTVVFVLVVWLLVRLSG